MQGSGCSGGELKASPQPFQRNYLSAITVKILQQHETQLTDNTEAVRGSAWRVDQNEFISSSRAKKIPIVKTRVTTVLIGGYEVFAGVKRANFYGAQMFMHILATGLLQVIHR